MVNINDVFIDYFIYKLYVAKKSRRNSLKEGFLEGTYSDISASDTISVEDIRNMQEMLRER